MTNSRMVTSYSPGCACCIAALLAAPVASASAAATTRAMAEQAFLGRYQPDTDVDFIAALDLDQRSIVARLAAGDEEGLIQARDFYTNGRDGGDSGSPGSTIMSLSTMAEADLSASSTYQTFVDYYGGGEYADKWVEASFKDAAINGFDFRNFDVEGRAAAIRWGIPLLHVWMYVVGLVETAAANCQTSGDNAEQIANFDKAVALYTGSVARESGSHGFFLYTLTQVECYEFGTCQKGGRSPVNTKIYDKLRDGKTHLQGGYCSAARDVAAEIKSLMTVLLVQGVIRAMYAMDVHDDFQETTQGMAAAFGSAILPLVNACSEGNAAVVLNDIVPGKGTQGSYEVVQAALERSYECLGINCEDVGGLVNFRGSGYLKRAEACNGLQPVTEPVRDSGLSMKGSNNKGESENLNAPAPAPTQTESEPEQDVVLVLGITFGFIAFFLGCGIASVFANRANRKRKMTEKMNDSDIVREAMFDETKSENEII